MLRLAVGCAEGGCEDARLQWSVLHTAVCQGEGERGRGGQPGWQVAINTFCKPLSERFMCILYIVLILDEYAKCI